MTDRPDPTGPDADPEREDLSPLALALLQLLDAGDNLATFAGRCGTEEAVDNWRAASQALTDALGVAGREGEA